MGPLKKYLYKTKYTLVKVTSATFLISVLILPFFQAENPSANIRVRENSDNEYRQELQPADSQSDINENPDIPKEEVPYDVKVDDFTVTLPNKKAVISLVEKIKDKYDASHEFKVSLKEQEGKSEQLVSIERQTPTDQTEIREISFMQNVSVAPSQAAEGVVDVDRAFDAVTGQKEQKTVYTVEEGDSLSVIAQKHNLFVQDILSLNEGLTEESIIRIGDSIVISVPVPELSVLVTKRIIYEEEYNAQIQYIQDDTMYSSESIVVQDGTAGRRIVTADVNYIDGREQSRDYISEEIVKESKPQIVRVGTLTPPTYVKPLRGGKLSSGFGYRWGKLHSGIDWSAPQGTQVIASSAGTVTQAGWHGSYGYCVEIRHSGGVVTRYAHLSKINVSVGQKVSQNQLIAHSGNTGDTTGPHLHFEIIVNGEAVNPLSYINQ